MDDETGMRSPRAIKLAGIMVAIWLSIGAVPASAQNADSITEFEERLAACPETDVAARLELAGWATERGLLGRADTVYRTVLSRSPAHDEAYRRLVDLASRRPLSNRPEGFLSAQRLLPPAFQVHESRHFLVLSNASPRWTRARLVTLEQAYDQFGRYARRVGLRPHPLRHKLVSVFFEDRLEYLAFGLEHDGMDASWSLGYYAIANDRTVLFNAESAAAADEFAAARSVASLVHETIHQLHYHTRIQNPHVQYPLWIVEGLATAFETDRSSSQFGPEHDFEPRRRRFLQLVDEEQLIPLEALAQLDRMPDGSRNSANTVYNQSYALVTWMANRRRSDLREYLSLMLMEPPGRPAPSRHLELFEAAFGDVNRLERVWLGHERTLAGQATDEAMATAPADSVGDGQRGPGPSATSSFWR